MALTTYTFRGLQIRGSRLAYEARRSHELALRTDVTPERQLGAPVATYLREKGVIGDAVLRPFELKKDDVEVMRWLGLETRRNGYNNGLMLAEARKVITSRTAAADNLKSLFCIDHDRAMGAIQGLLEDPEANLDGWNKLASDWWMRGGRKTRIDLSGLDMSGLQLPWVKLPNTDFTYTNLCGADMHCGWFSQSLFVRSDLRGADMRSTHLWYTTFWKPELDRSDFSGAEVTDGVRRDVQQHARYDSLRTLAA